MAELSKTLKEGERILAPTRRPDGTLRKSIRIRAGYVPQDEVAVYQPKGALLKKEMESQILVPPGYDPALDAKPKSKSAKRNERKKEKRLQAAFERGNSSEDVDVNSDEVQSIRDLGRTSKSVEALTSQMNEVAVSSKPIDMNPPVVSVDGSCPGDAVQDIDKKIRALKKKLNRFEELGWTLLVSLYK
ncbi:Partner of Y14 and mago [Linum perenne]